SAIRFTAVDAETQSRFHKVRSGHATNVPRTRIGKMSVLVSSTNSSASVNGELMPIRPACLKAARWAISAGAVTPSRAAVGRVQSCSWRREIRRIRSLPASSLRQGREEQVFTDGDSNIDVTLSFHFLL